MIDIPPTGFGPIVSRTVREGDRVRVMVRLPAPLVRDLAVAARSRGCSMARMVSDILADTDIAAYGFGRDGDAPA